jgi:hypothetical protein
VVIFSQQVGSDEFLHDARILSGRFRERKKNFFVFAFFRSRA